MRLMLLFTIFGIVSMFYDCLDCFLGGKCKLCSLASVEIVSK